MVWSLLEFCSRLMRNLLACSQISLVCGYNPLWERRFEFPPSVAEGIAECENRLGGGLVGTLGPVFCGVVTDYH